MCVSHTTKYSTGMEMKELLLHPAIGMNLTVTALGGLDTKIYLLCNFIDIQFYKIVKAKLQC